MFYLHALQLQIVGWNLHCTSITEGLQKILVTCITLLSTNCQSLVDDSRHKPVGLLLFMWIPSIMSEYFPELRLWWSVVVEKLHCECVEDADKVFEWILQSAGHKMHLSNGVVEDI